MNKYEIKFVNDVNEKYGNGVYLFDKMVYINQHTDIELFCTKHNGYFTITPMHMVRATCKGCNICTKNTAYTTEEFISKCESIHPGKFLYDNTIYINQKHKVNVFCINGNHTYEINPSTLLKNKTGCAICNGKIHTHDTFVAKALLVHGDKYDYSTELYIKSEQKMNIMCKEHGLFSQTPRSHLYGKGCPECGEYGYQPNKPGVFYLQKLTSDDKIVYKFGITGNVERRITEQTRNSVFEHELLKTINFEQGIDALNLENIIKSTIPTGIVTKDELKSGFSETFSEEYLEIVLKLIEDSL